LRSGIEPVGELAQGLGKFAVGQFARRVAYLVDEQRLGIVRVVPDEQNDSRVPGRVPEDAGCFLGR
jgi:hypothetical protein